MSSNPEVVCSRALKKNLDKRLFCWGVGLGMVMPLGQFSPNAAVGLLANVLVLYAYNSCTSLYFCLAHEIIEWGKNLYPAFSHSPPLSPIVPYANLSCIPEPAVLRFPGR